MRLVINARQDEVRVMSRMFHFIQSVIFSFASCSPHSIQPHIHMSHPAPLPVRALSGCNTAPA
jgi:hypothetical protein